MLFAVAGLMICNASPIDGKWKASMEGPQGAMELIFTFKVDGNKLTGTVTTPMGESELKNGKVNGNEFSFDVDMRDDLIPHKCKLEGDVIKMKVEMPKPGDMGGGDNPPPGEMILKKVE